MAGETLTIFHTNDFHNHLTPDIAAKIKAAREAVATDTLLLDAGDAVSAGNVGVRIGGEPILTLMSDIGYDAMTMGNREFHVADVALRHKIGAARFPILSANLRYKEDRGETLPTVPNVILTTASGIRVGVFGLTVLMVTERMAARHLSAFLFDDAVKTATAQVAALRDQVDIVILLSHVGYKLDQRIAAEVPGIDLVIGGHSHVILEQADRDHGAPIMQTGSFARYLGRVEMARNASGRWTVSSSNLTELKGT